MNVKGGCYCGSIRYQAEGDALFKGQCHCRECQYISGGSPVLVMVMPEAGFSWTSGSPKGFARSDIENPVTSPLETSRQPGFGKPGGQCLVTRTQTNR